MKAIGARCSSIGAEHTASVGSRHIEAFDFEKAFVRNLGWVTPDEQALLRSRRVAIAGLGGVGGAHLVTLTRLGIGRFSIADPDAFGIENFNRQLGARMSTLARPKSDVLAEMALDVNPELELRVFGDGVSEANLDDFLDGVDLYVDGLDFFAVAIRRAVFAACAERGIPAVTAAPLGMGAALLCFLPGRMTFEEYFALDGASEDEQLLRFFVGLAPAGLQQRYLVDPSSIDLANHRGPSTAMGCELCAGVAASQALKLLLHRGNVVAAPWGLQYDAYLNRLRRTWRPGGNRHPVQRYAMARVRSGLAAARRPAPAGEPDAVERVLDLARWAPSGDNAQPWRFERLGERSFAVHGLPGGRDIYDLQGHATQLALGALLETIAIAARGDGARAEVARRAGAPPVFDVSLMDADAAGPDPLATVIRARSVQRRPLSTTPLTARQRDALVQATAPFEVRFVDRRRAARLNFANALLRLGTPEAFATHAAAIEWGAERSEDRLPDRALGVDPLTARVMRWALGRQSRAVRLDRLGGSLGPAVQMSLLPGLACAAHFVLVAPHAPLDYLEAGRAVQRFWLTATVLGLQLQPEYTPLVFNEYLRDGVPFTADERSLRRARSLVARLGELIGADVLARAVFYGRLGAGRPATARSTRLPLERLMVD
jgi:molybdopterin/thiamine biosynthesis adenylyltransferase/nitroreductase